MTQYRMFSDTALAKFREFAAAAQINQHHPQGAFDAKPRGMARDQEPPIDDLVALIEKLLADNSKAKRLAKDQDPDRNDKHGELMADLVELKSLLEAKQGNLGPEELKQALALISHWVEGNSTVNRETSPVGDEDQPPPFKGQPQRGGAMDAASFNARFPMAARIGVNGAAPARHGALDRLHANMARIGIV